MSVVAHNVEVDWTGRSSIDGRCPVVHTLDVLNSRWTTLVIRELLGGPRRFGELRRGAGPVAAKTLTERLRHLEAAGIVERRAYAEVPPRVEYRLTDRGRSLERVLSAMWHWGAENLRSSPSPEPARE